MATTTATAATLLAMCHVALVCASAATVAMDPSDRAALEAVRGGTWGGFPAIACDGYYFECDEAGRVTELYFSSLHGIIAPEIGNLTKLTRLHLGELYLTGRIPDSIGQLKSLLYLRLSSNQLSGPIPESIGELRFLQFLYLHNNALTGSIPDSIGQLTSLQQFHLYNNQLSGEIPDSIGQLTSLEWWSAYNNQLSGSIPNSIGQMESIQKLELRINQLSGPIPDSIGQLKSLRTLDLSGNQLNGTIPESFGQLSSLLLLSLTMNQLSGSIPNSFRELNSSLKFLSLGYNQLSGSFSDFFCQLTLLNSLSLSGNQLSGRIPECIGQLKSLVIVLITDNQLSGGIPKSITKLKLLQYLNVTSNYLTGPVASVNGHPACNELMTNCLLGNNLPSKCPPRDQRTKEECEAFCDATQVGGPCGGRGICSNRTNENTFKCTCDKGYNNLDNEFACVGLFPPSPRKIPPPQNLFPSKIPPPPTVILPPPPTKRVSPPPNIVSPPPNGKPPPQPKFSPPPPPLVIPPEMRPPPVIFPPIMENKYPPISLPPLPRLPTPPPSPPPRPSPPPPPSPPLPPPPTPPSPPPSPPPRAPPPQVKPKPPTNFTFISFQRNSPIIYLNDASLWSPWLRLTPPLAMQHGQTLYSSPIELLRTNAAKTCQGASFQTSFSFRIRNYAPEIGEGLTFLLLASNANLKRFGNGAGETLGYSYSGSPLPGSVAVAFDTFFNVGELRQRNVAFRESFRSASIVPTVSTTLNRFNKTLYAWVDYNDTSTTWKVYFGSSVNKPRQPLVTYKRALCSLLRPTQCVTCSQVTSAYIGFTASTSSGSDNHEIRQWSFTSY